MSNLNYARIRNTKQKSDINLEPKNFEFPPAPEIHPSSPTTLPVGERTPFPGATVKIESSGLKNLFGENVHMDNLDYINSLLGSVSEPIARPQRKKKGKEKTLDLPVQIAAPVPEKVQAQAPAPTPEGLTKATSNSVAVGDLDSSVLVTVGEVNYDEEKLKESKGEEEELKLVYERNYFSNNLSTKEGNVYGEVLNYDNMKRSQSVEDIRVAKRDSPKMSGFGRNNFGIATEEEGQGKEFLEGSEKNGTDCKSMKSDFVASLGQYIDYFQKSEASQFRTTKASQYFVSMANKRASNSHIQIQNTMPEQSQRLSPTANAEMEKMKSQMKKMREKMEEMQMNNEMLQKERKMWKRRNHELMLRAENAEAGMEKAMRKVRQYKEKIKRTEDMLHREKLDSESNLLALKRVLANNISTVLEHKINHYMSSQIESPSRDRKLKNVWPEAKHMTNKSHAHKEKDKKSMSTYSHHAYNGSLHQSSGQMGSRYEENNNIKKRTKGSLQEKMSPLLSHKDQSFSDEDLKDLDDKYDEFSDELYQDYDEREKVQPRRTKVPQFSDMDTSSDPTEDLLSGGYNSQGQNSYKIQQIQFLQNKLAKLIDNDDSLTQTSGQMNYNHSISHRNLDSGMNIKIKTRGHTNSISHYKGQQNNVCNINQGRKTHEGSPPPAELHNQPNFY